MGGRAAHPDRRGEQDPPHHLRDGRQVPGEDAPVLQGPGRAAPGRGLVRDRRRRGGVVSNRGTRLVPKGHVPKVEERPKRSPPPARSLENFLEWESGGS